MPIDFNKLRDPEWQAKVRQEEEKRQAAREAKETKQRNAVDLCLRQYETLTERERSLVRSCQTRLNTFQLITENQEKWLLDIARRFEKPVEANPMSLRPRDAQSVHFWPIHRCIPDQTLNGNAYSGVYQDGIFMAEGIPWEAHEIEYWAPTLST